MKTQNPSFKLFLRSISLVTVLALVFVSCNENKATTQNQMTHNVENDLPAPPVVMDVIKQDSTKTKTTLEDEHKVTKRIIGDPIDVINLNRENYDYAVNGKMINYEKAIEVLAKNSKFNVSMDTINGRPLMIIKTLKTSIGPSLVEEGDGC